VGKVDRREIIARRLKEAREALGLTQDKAAEAAGCSAMTIWRYENGDRQPSLLIVRGLAVIYQCEYEWLMGEEDSPHLVRSIAENRGAYTTGVGLSQGTDDYWRAMSVLVRDVPEEKQGETVDIIHQVIELAKEND